MAHNANLSGSRNVFICQIFKLHSVWASHGEWKHDVITAVDHSTLGIDYGFLGFVLLISHVSNFLFTFLFSSWRCNCVLSVKILWKQSTVYIFTGFFSSPACPDWLWGSCSLIYSGYCGPLLRCKVTKAWS
jgi:hypothetical protein